MVGNQLTGEAQTSTAPRTAGARSPKYARTPWSVRRLYRPFVVASLVVALTMGFTVGAGMLVWAAVGRPEESWATHLQPHGVAQIFGWAGLFVMGIAMHVVPRFRGNARVRFPRPQQATLTLVLAGIALRATGQALYRHEVSAPLLIASGVALLAGVVVFALTLAEVLRGGRRSGVAIEHWLWTGITWAVVAASMHLWIVLDMAGGTRVAADPDLDRAFVWLGIAGFVLPFIFAVSRRAVAGFLGLRPGHDRIDAAACLLLNAGLTRLALSPALDADRAGFAVGTLVVAAALGAFVLGLRIFEAPLRPAAVSPGSYPRYGWALRAAYGWLVVGAALLAAASLADLSLLPDLRLRVLAPLHTIAVGFVSLTIVGFAARALPLFEQRASVPRQWLVDTAVVALNVSALMRLVFSVAEVSASTGGLAVSGAVGLLGIACFAGFASGVLRSSARPEVDTTRLTTPAAQAAETPRPIRGTHH